MLHRRKNISIFGVRVYCSIVHPVSHPAPRALIVIMVVHICITPRDHPTCILKKGGLSEPHLQNINQVTS